VQLLRRVRELDLDVPVILMTGNPDVGSAMLAVEHGALRYLVKPITASAVTTVVAQAVRLCRLSRWKREALEHVFSGQRLMGDRAAIDAAFRAALDSLRLAGQTIVYSADRRPFGLELLARTSSRVLTNPIALFDAAERLDLLHELGREVRRRAATIDAPGGVLFVNAHPRDLLDDELYSASSPLAARARSTVLEVTERGGLDRVPDLEGRVKALRALGYRLALDDLGAGYSGLNSFAALAPDVVKLDMSLVRGVDQDPIRRKLVGSMAQLSHDLGTLVIAEGVETEAELACVSELGCELAQGYLLGLPQMMETV